MVGTRAIGLAVCVAIALAAGSMSAATQVDPRFVITGDAAAAVGETNMINDATAVAIANACVRLATARGETMAIIILDNLGNLVHARRMDGDTIRSIMFAERKARTAKITRRPSHLLQNTVAQNPNRQHFVYNMGFLPNAGGLPIWVGDQIIGFIGVGGSNPRPPEWSDEICAHRAIEEVIGAQPPLTPDPE